jgi:hypothetical protein
MQNLLGNRKNQHLKFSKYQEYCSGSQCLTVHKLAKSVLLTGNIERRLTVFVVSPVLPRVGGILSSMVPTLLVLPIGSHITKMNISFND